MHIQLNGSALDGIQGGTAAVEGTLRERFARFENRLTRVEVHFEDVNAERGGPNDKRCLIEVRPNNAAPIAVSDRAAGAGPAMAGAISKAVAAMETHFGKQDNKRS